MALPNDVKVLGTGVGFFFLIINLPINFGAGYILSLAADRIEQGGDMVDSDGLKNAEERIKKARQTTRLMSESEDTKRYTANSSTE